MPNMRTSSPESVYRTLSLAQGDRQVLWADLNCSELGALWACPHAAQLPPSGSGKRVESVATVGRQGWLLRESRTDEVDPARI